MKDRIIFHVDMNNFFASVEGRGRPELRDVPYAVCGDPAMRHGIVLAKNTIAKGYGVKTGEPIFAAKQKCPSLIVLPPHYEKYEAISKAARRIYSDYSDRVESFGIDECWCDISAESDIKRAEELANELRARIKRELDVTVSIGVSFNKIFAKLGSDYKKPDATTVITRDNFRRLVWALPVSDLLFVGSATERALSRYGIHTIGDLACTDRGFLRLILGKNGETLHTYANGEDHSPVLRKDDIPPPKSVSKSATLPYDLVSFGQLRALAHDMTEELCVRLRELDMLGGTVGIMLKDSELHSFIKQKSLERPSLLAYDILRAAEELIRSSYTEGTPIRAFGIRISELSDYSGSQLTFDTDGVHERRERLEATLFSLRKRYGDSVTLGQSEEFSRAKENLNAPQGFPIYRR